MGNFEILIKVKEYADKSLLPAEEQALLKKAEEATASSYAPYSHFNVGAAVLLENGEVVSGSNQENTAYPSGLCAERVAMFYANARYPNVKIKAIAVSSTIEGKLNEAPVYPCGGCRQALMESELRQDSPIKVLMAGSKRVQEVAGISSLLPLSFDLKKFK